MTDKVLEAVYRKTRQVGKPALVAKKLLFQLQAHFGTPLSSGDQNDSGAIWCAAHGRFCAIDFNGEKVCRMVRVVRDGISSLKPKERL
jgi:hypothetical protein